MPTELEERIAKIEERLDILFPAPMMFQCTHEPDERCLWCPCYLPYSQRLRKRLALERFAEGLITLSGTLNEWLQRHLQQSDTTPPI